MAVLPQNNLPIAEEYIKAAWQWGQHDDVGDHLAQIYKRQGKRTAAIRIWRLALVSNSKNEEARQELQKAGAPVVERAATNGQRSGGAPISAAEEFGLLRTIKIPALPTQIGSAEFFLLIGRNGIEDVRLIGESDKFKEAGRAITAAQYAWAFPDEGPEKIVRRGILSCSTYTHPSCELTMLLPSTTNLDGALSHSTEGQNASSGSAAVVPPTVLTKVEPEYSKEALEARVEGTVRLSIVISETGVPDNVTVVQPLGMGLDEKARECVLQWRFRPAMREGKPVRTDANIEVNFRLRKETP
jgi:TonB family protein